jgi:hypothetical protein
MFDIKESKSTKDDFERLPAISSCNQSTEILGRTQAMDGSDLVCPVAVDTLVRVQVES